MAWADTKIPKAKLVLAMERDARRKLKLCFINVLDLAHTHQQRYSRTAEIASTPQKKKTLILMHCLSPSSENLSNLHQTFTSNSMLLGCPEVSKITIFRGPHVRLIFDRQTTDCLLKNDPQTDPKSREMGAYFRHFF